MFVLFLLYRIVFFTWRHFFFLFFIICILLVLHVGNIYLVIYFRCWMPLGTCLMSKGIQFKSIRCSLRFLFAEVILYALIVFLLWTIAATLFLKNTPQLQSFSKIFHVISWCFSFHSGTVLSIYPLHHNRLLTFPVHFSLM